MINKQGAAQLALGQELMKKGDKKLKGGFLSGVFSNKSERAELALESYKSAAVQFKLANAWDEAAEAFLRCAQCEQLSEGCSVGEHYVEASNMKKRTNKAEAITYLEKAIDYFSNENRLSYAGKLQKQIAEIYEQEDQKDLAMAAYERAAHFFELDSGSSSDYQNTQIKIADLISEKEPEEFAKAIQILEEVGRKYCENRLTQGVAGNIFFKCSLLYLAINDTIGCEKALESYCDICPPFGNTRQAKFISKVLVSQAEFNAENFSQECFEFNQIIPLDRQQLRLLNLAKNHVKSGFDPLGVEHQDNDEMIL